MYLVLKIMCMLNFLDTFSMGVTSFIHDCISHPEPCSAVSLQISLYLSLCQAASSNKRTTCNHHFHQKCHTQCVWSRDVTNQSFQVASLNNRTTCILPFTFIICQVASPNNRTTCVFPFTFIICQVASPNNRTACVFPFTFIICQVASPNNRIACVFPFTFIVCQVVSSDQRTVFIYTFLPYVKWQVLHMNNLQIL